MHVYKQLSIHCLFTGYSLWWDQKVILNSHYLCRCGQALWSPSGRSSWRRQRTFPDSAPCLLWSPSCLCQRGLLALLPLTWPVLEPAWCNTCTQLLIKLYVLYIEMLVCMCICMCMCVCVYMLMRTCVCMCEYLCFILVGGSVCMCALCVCVCVCACVDR